MSRTFAWPYQPSLTLAPHSNCGSCDRTGIVCCCKQQIGRAHVCSMGPKYVKCFRRKKDRMEFVECLSHYNKAIDAHTSLIHKGIITHEKKKKKKKKEKNNYESKREISEMRSRSENCTLGICKTSKECTKTNSLVHETKMESHTLLSP